MSEAQEVHEPDSTAVTMLEQGLVTLLANMPFGANAANPDHPHETFARMHEDDPVYLLGGLQRIAWTADALRTDYDRELSAYHEQERTRLRLAGEQSA
ncbi:MAG: hypothetical protein JJT89_00480 [Nitriliruptoraceae bacterium]|nr:hypothetical protein [Nitriliruptoraceae bacterium]